MGNQMVLEDLLLSTGIFMKDSLEMGCQMVGEERYMASTDLANQDGSEMEKDMVTTESMTVMEILLWKLGFNLVMHMVN